MTQEQILREIQAPPLVIQMSLLEEISRNIRASFSENQPNGKRHSHEPTPEERRTASGRLRGALKMDNPLVTKQETKDLIAEYLSDNVMSSCSSKQSSHS